jgi:hypothetical protein
MARILSVASVVAILLGLLLFSGNPSVHSQLSSPGGDDPTSTTATVADSCSSCMHATVCYLSAGPSAAQSPPLAEDGNFLAPDASLLSSNNTNTTGNNASGTTGTTEFNNLVMGLPPVACSSVAATSQHLGGLTLTRAANSCMTHHVECSMQQSTGITTHQTLPTNRDV